MSLHFALCHPNLPPLSPAHTPAILNTKVTFRTSFLFPYLTGTTRDASNTFFIFNIVSKLYKHLFYFIFLHNAQTSGVCFQPSNLVTSHTGVKSALCLCLCQHLPGALSIQSAHSPSGAWEKSVMNMNLKAPSIRRQSRTARTKG